MPPGVIDLQLSDDRRDVVHRAVQALTEGLIVVFPTDLGYFAAASALSSAAVEKLSKAIGEGCESVLGVKHGDEAADYLPPGYGLARRLMRRGWPGPLYIEFPVDDAQTAMGRLPRPVRDLLVNDGQVRVWLPCHKVIQDVLQLLVGPIVMIEPRGGAETLTGALKAFGDSAALALDDGPTCGDRPTIVQVAPDGYKASVVGSTSETALRRWANLIIVFVCTGNTCRSPMAERIAKHLFAQKFGVAPEELPDKGIQIVSAGLAAHRGSQATPEAVDVLAEKGIDLHGHVSQPISEQMVRQADWLLVMTNSHRQAILYEYPDAADRVRLLSPEARDVADPIGGTEEHYRRCADQIESYLKTWIQDLEA